MQYPDSSQPIPERAQKVFSGVIFDIWQWQQQMFDGTIQVFEKAKRKPSVGIFAFTKDKKIILTKQEQPAMKPFISLVGGINDDGEDPAQTAARELLEETGHQSSDIEFWYSVQHVTKIEWPIYMFVARNCEKVAEINPDSGEKIQLEYVTWSEFVELLYTQEFRDKEVALKILRLQKNPEQIEQLKKFLFNE